MQPVWTACGLRQRTRAGERLAAPAVMLAPVDEPGVDAERDVVEEEPVAGLPDVDPPLDRAVVEGCERAERIVAVETDISREMVPRAERDADERSVRLERDRGDGCERAVAARTSSAGLGSSSPERGLIKRRRCTAGLR